MSVDETSKTITPASNKNSGEGFRLHVSKDRLAVLLCCDKHAVWNSDLETEIRGKLQEMGVVCQLETDKMADAVARAQAAEANIADLEIARGEPSVPGSDGVIEWTREDYFADGWYIDPVTKRIDFRQRVAAPTVDEGELLVKLHPPDPGKGGSDEA